MELHMLVSRTDKYFRDMKGDVMNAQAQMPLGLGLWLMLEPTQL